MAGYHNIVMPDRFSQGSSFTVGYDTRITTLESGIETRMSRYSPHGRRKYSVLRGIADKDEIQALYEFYMLRQGALNAFKFKDWFDYATNATRTTFQPDDPPILHSDSQMIGLSDTRYQMTTTYQDSAASIVRPLTKIKQGTEVIGVNGSTESPANYTVDYETGIVTFDPGLTINSATCGCEFYVPVRFAESTDEAFEVAMQATLETQSLPGFELIEELFPATVSQDFYYGGSHQIDAINEFVTLAEINGRVQTLTNVTSINAGVRLPGTLDMPTGGPIFIIHNHSSSTQPVPIISGLATLETLAVGETAMIFLGEIDPNGKLWYAVK